MARIDSPGKEKLIGVVITAGGIIFEWVLRSLLHWHYVGITLALLTYIMIEAHKYAEMKNSFNMLQDEVIKLKQHHELLTAPKGYLDYLFDVFNRLKNPNGYPFHTQEYTEILAKFLTATKQSFAATWTIDIDLNHMSDTYKEQQKRCMKSKRRFLFLSDTVLKAQQIDKREKLIQFINWHKESGIKLFWVDKQKCINSLIQNGLTSEVIDSMLPQCEDFILVDDDVVLFYDTKDEIREGAPPEPGKPYSVSLIYMDSLERSLDPSFQNISKFIKSICLSKKATKIEDIRDLEIVLDP